MLSGHHGDVYFFCSQACPDLALWPLHLIGAEVSGRHPHQVLPYPHYLFYLVSEALLGT